MKTVGKITSQEYLDLERLAHTKSEFIHGETRAWEGGSPAHSRIVMNLTLALGTAARQRGCQAFGSDLKVGIDGSIYCYPDLSIVCGQPLFVSNKNDVLANPTVIVEVLSPSTEAYDRGTKFHSYQEIESLQQYVLVSQDQIAVDVFTRRASVWVLESVVTPTSSVTLEALNVSLSMQEVYEGVAFEPVR